LDEALFSRVDGIVSSRHALGSVCVVMIGLGSLGGRVAELLAQSGLSKFVLFDPERLEPENVSRHVGGVDQLFTPKVAVVRDAILRRSPGAEVAAYAEDPLFSYPWRKAAGYTALREAMSDPNSIVVVTTATERTERAVNRLAVEFSRPAVFATVLGRAEHGRVFRVLPGETACYRCVVDAQRRTPGEFPSFARPDLNPAYSQGGVAGLAVGVDQVAIIAGRLTLETVAQQHGVDLNDSTPLADHVLWSNCGGWVFDRPLQAIDQVFPMAPDCPVCGEASHHASPAADVDLAQLLVSATDERRLGASNYAQLDVADRE
jgi:molybdopterin/thiamine biosynthesis adenylyltransferase